MERRPSPFVAVVAGTALVALFAFFFVFPAHDPEPRGVPVAVAGPTEPATQAAAGLAVRGGAFDVLQVPDRAAALAAIRDREVYGALVVGGAQPEMLIASAASVPVAQVLTAVGGRSRATVTEVAPLDPQDPRGLTLNLLVLATTVPAILGALLLFQLAPTIDPRGRILLAALFGLLGALASVLVVRVGIGALPGSVPALLGVLALGITGIVMASAAIIRRLGPPGVGAAFILFLMLGNPASGAGSAPELLPEPWQSLGQFLPPGAIADAVRGTAYFDGAGALVPCVVLALYAVGGAAALLAMGRATAPPVTPA